MKPSGFIVALMTAVVLISMSWADAGGASDGYYSLDSTAPAWDGTYANRLTPPSPDYDYTYGDDASVAYTLPWNFTFYGRSYSRITADTNGNIWFTATDAAYSFSLGATGRGPVISVWHNDLSSVFLGGVFIQHKSDPERVIIEWQSETYREAGTLSPSRLEVIIFQDGSIRFDYGGFVTQAGEDLGSGISQGDGTTALNLTQFAGGAVTALAGNSFLYSPQAVYTLNVSKSGQGNGTITSSPSGISCGTACSSSFVPGTSVTLRATPDFGYAFSGWTGACTGTDHCTLSMDAVKNVGSSFVPTPAPIVSIAGPSGAVASTSPILNFAVSRGVAVVKVDGQVVTAQSGEVLGPLSDGPHVVRIEATDVSGNWGYAESVFIVDTAPPILADVTPANGSSNAPVRLPILVRFSEVIDASSIVTGMISLTSKGGQLPGSFSLTSDGKALIFKSSERLAYGASYSFTLKAGVRDMVGNTQASDLSSSFTTQVVDPDIVGYWPMDDDWNDYSGQGNNARGYGSAAFVAGRTPGVKAGEFILNSKIYDGSGGFVAPGPAYLASAPNTFTVSFWARPTATRSATAESASGMSGGSGQRYAIGPVDLSDVASDLAGTGVSVGTNGISVFERTSVYATVSDITAWWGHFPSLLVYDTPLSGWNHIVVVFNNKQPSLYLNGQFIKAGRTSNRQVLYPSLAFGDLDTGSGAYSGEMGEMAIFRRALNSDEVQSLYRDSSRQRPEVALTSPGETASYKPGENGTATMTARAADGVTQVYCAAVGAVGGGYLAESFLSPEVNVARQLSFQVAQNATPHDSLRFTCAAQTADGILGAGDLLLHAADVIPPRVIATAPVNNATDVSATKPITITFSEAIDRSSVVSRETFMFRRADTWAFVPGYYKISEDGKNLFSLPSPALNADTDYVIALSGLRDLAGNLLSDYSLHFKTLQQVNLTLDGKGTQAAPYVLPPGRYGNLVINNSCVSINGSVVADSITISNSTMNLAVGPLGEPGNLSAEYGDLIVSGSKVTINGTLIVAGNVSQTNSTMSVTGTITVSSNVSLNTSTLTIKSKMKVTGSVTLLNGSVMTHFAATQTSTSELNLIADAVNIDATSKIDVTGKGYLGGYQRGDNPFVVRVYSDCYGEYYVSAVGENNTSTGRTIGNTTTGGSRSTNGASYGGIGGSINDLSNKAYGEISAPNDLGSGGGGLFDDLFTGLCDVLTYRSGGNGGGLIKLVATEVQLNGSITANGANSQAGAGSGGGVVINAKTITGSGLITVNGGNSSGWQSGGGGGGRIALYFDILSPAINLTARGGSSAINGSAGTIFLKKGNNYPDIIIENNKLIASSSTPIPGGQYGMIYVGQSTNVAFDGPVTIQSEISEINGSTVSINGDLQVNNQISLANSNVILYGNANIFGVLKLNNSKIINAYNIKVNGDLSLFNSSFENVSSMIIIGKVNAENSMIRCINLHVDKDIVSNKSVFTSSYLNSNGHIYLSNQTVLSHDYSTTTASFFMKLSAEYINLDNTSKIDVSSKGYLGSFRGENNTSSGRTLGNKVGSGMYNGGGYGGYGGISSGSTNELYGDLLNPDEVGSGGGGNAGGNSGGNGGGLVHISTKNLLLNGNIIADGGGASGIYSGGGSGGGININAGNISGTGYIYARGGTSASRGGGGGGRIAIYYDSLSVPLSNVTANGGGGVPQGAAGTLYFMSKMDQKDHLIIDNRGQDTISSTALRFLGSGTVTGVSCDKLFSSGENWKPGAFKGMRFKPNISKSTIFTIIENDGDSLRIDSTEGDLTAVTAVGLKFAGVYSFDKLSIVNKGRLTSIDDLKTKELTVEDSTLVANVITGQSLLLGSGSLLRHWSTNSSQEYRMELVFSEKIIIDGASIIDVTGGGYPGAFERGNNTSSGRTYGNRSGSSMYSGGGYGGNGGIPSGSANVLYGDLFNPDELGSGGGGNAGVNDHGGSGGGLVRITTGTLQMDGKFVADGGVAKGVYSGGGSGGGIRIDATSIVGNGSISARGGSSASRGGGGGGRIAIYYDHFSIPLSNISANGGDGIPQGAAGTLYLRSKVDGKDHLVINNVGQDTISSTALRVMGGGIITGLTSDTVIASGSNWLPGALKGMKFKPDVDKEIVFTVIENGVTSLRIDANEGDLTAVTSIGKVFSGVYPFVQLTLIGKGRLTSQDPISIEGDLSLDGSCMTASVIQGNTLSLANGSSLTHWPATTSKHYGLELIFRSISVDAASGINVSARGYLGSFQGGNNSSYGRTIGNKNGSAMYNGGSYGGLGGIYSGIVNPLYGDRSNPGEPGSGGGGNASSSEHGGSGGGLIRMTAEALHLDGSIIADGGAGSYGGGGSGGGILLDLGALTGSGFVSARGGASIYRGGGGGGLVAITYDSMTLPVGNISVAGSGALFGGIGQLTFVPKRVPLTVSVSGGGSGVIISAPQGISCASCSALFPRSSVAELTAVPDSSSIFKGWSGACTGTGTCAVTMDAAKSVTAIFNLLPPKVAIGFPAGLIRNNRPNLQYTISSGTAVVKVDGNEVHKTSGEMLDWLPDGSHTIRVEATNGGGTSFAESAFTINTLGATLTVALPVAEITAGYQGEVPLYVDHLPAVSDEVVVEQFVDADRNGTIDGTDYVIRSLRVRDGVGPRNPGAPGDEDGEANASVSITFNYYLLNDLFHAPGHYIVRATAGNQSSATPFRVIPLLYEQAISGKVTNGSVALAGAIVQVRDRWQRHVSFGIADEQGEYFLPLREPGTYKLVPYAYGYVARNDASFVSVEDEQVSSGNVLVLLKGSNHLYGRCTDTEGGNGIDGLWVTASSGDYTGVAITDLEGQFDLSLPAGPYEVRISDGMEIPSPAAKGYLRVRRGIENVPVPGSGPLEFKLPLPDVFVDGKVTDSAGNALTGAPLEGIQVFYYPHGQMIDLNEPRGGAISDAGGMYSLGLCHSDTWKIGLFEQYIDYVASTKFPVATRTGTLDANDVTTKKVTAWIDGYLKDGGGLPVPNATIEMADTEQNVISTALTDKDGFFRFGIAAGTWHLEVESSPTVQFYGAPSREVTVSDGERVSISMVADFRAPFFTVEKVPLATNQEAVVLSGARTDGVIVSGNRSEFMVEYPTASSWRGTQQLSATEGNFTTMIVGTAPSGRVDFFPFALNVDRSRPVVSIDSPVAYGVYDVAPILRFSIADRNPVRVVIKVDGKEVQRRWGDALDLGVGNHSLLVEATDIAGNTGFSSIVFAVGAAPVPVRSVDNFESGNFSALPWIMSGDGMWSVAAGAGFMNSSGAVSPLLQRDGERAVLEMNHLCITSGSLRFKYGADLPGDYQGEAPFVFAIDGVPKLSDRGVVPLASTTYSLSPGPHRFTWTYTRHDAPLPGKNSVWIDDVLIACNVQKKTR